MTSRSIYRVEVRGRNAAGATTTYHFATETFSTSPSRANVPSTFLEGRLEQPLLFKRDMYGSNQARGSVSIAHGSISLQNADGALDYLANIGFDAEPVALYRIDTDFPDVDVFVWKGNTESVTLDEKEIRFTVRELTYQLDLAMQPVKYAGNNVLPAGLEGTAENIKGKPKPIWLGNVWNVSPPVVNTSRLIYQLADQSIPGTVTWSITVYDARVVIAQGMNLTTAKLNDSSQVNYFRADAVTDVATTVIDAGVSTAVPHNMTTGDRIFVDRASNSTDPADLAAPLVANFYYYARVTSASDFTFHPTEADAIANTAIVNLTTNGSLFFQRVHRNTTLPGKVDWCNQTDSGGFFLRFGSKPVGQPTVDATRNDSDTLAGALGLLMARLSARGFGAITVANTVGHTPHAAIADQKLGIYITDETKVYQVAQDLSASLGASFAVYPRDVAATHLVTARIERATVEPAILTITDGDIVKGSFKRMVAGDQERGTPAHRVNLRHTKNYTVQTGDAIAGAAVDVAFAAQEYRIKVNDFATVLTQYPAAPEINYDTLLADEAAGSLMATYLVGSASSMFSGKRDVVKVTVPLSLIVSDVSVSLANSTGTNLALTGISGLVMGKPIALSLTRFTRTVFLIGYEIDIQKETVDLTAWG